MGAAFLCRLKGQWNIIWGFRKCSWTWHLYRCTFPVPVQFFARLPVVSLLNPSSDSFAIGHVFSHTERSARTWDNGARASRMIHLRIFPNGHNVESNGCTGKKLWRMGRLENSLVGFAGTVVGSKVGDDLCLKDVSCHSSWRVKPYREWQVQSPSESHVSYAGWSTFHEMRLLRFCAMYCIVCDLSPVQGFLGYLFTIHSLNIIERVNRSTWVPSHWVV